MTSEINELERKLQRLKLEEAEKKRRETRQAQENIEKELGVSTYWSDDYAGLSTGKYSFYYGYEETMCPKHKEKDCEDKYDCDEREWCFTADIGKKEVMRVPRSKLTYEHKDVLELLLIGIGIFFNEYLSSDEKERDKK